MVNSENASENENRTVEHVQRRRSMGSKEQAIKDAVVLVGSLFLIMSFGLLFEANIRDNGWNDSTQKRITVLASGVGFFVVAIMFSYYLYLRIRRNNRRSESVITDNNELRCDNRINEETTDIPPNYDTIMGSPPSYHTIKIEECDKNEAVIHV